MKTDSATERADAPAVIPPPPGGGSWIWDGGKWLPNERAAETPSEPSPITQE